MKIKKRKSKKRRTQKQIQATKENFAIVRLRGMVVNLENILVEFPIMSPDIDKAISGVTNCFCRLKKLQEKRISGKK